MQINIPHFEMTDNDRYQRCLNIIYLVLAAEPPPFPFLLRLHTVFFPSIYFMLRFTITPQGGCEIKEMDMLYHCYVHRATVQFSITVFFISLSCILMTYSVKPNIATSVECNEGINYTFCIQACRGKKNLQVNLLKFAIFLIAFSFWV